MSMHYAVQLKQATRAAATASQPAALRVHLFLCIVECIRLKWFEINVWNESIKGVVAFVCGTQNDSPEKNFKSRLFVSSRAVCVCARAKLVKEILPSSSWSSLFSLSSSSLLLSASVRIGCIAVHGASEQGTEHRNRDAQMKTRKMARNHKGAR